MAHVELYSSTLNDLFSSQTIILNCSRVHCCAQWILTAEIMIYENRIGAVSLTILVSFKGCVLGACAGTGDHRVQHGSGKRGSFPLAEPHWYDSYMHYYLDHYSYKHLWHC